MRRGSRLASPLFLLLAFAFSVMGDPVSSVAYAIEAALRALSGHISLLIVTMAVVLGIIALVDVNYHQLVDRFPKGGGAAAAAGRAFGDAWAFLPLGALIVDYTLTIAISVAAGAAALIAYAPALAPDRVPIGLGLTLLVAALTWFGHGGRSLFALMTLAFIGSAAVVLVHGFAHPVSLGGGTIRAGAPPSILPALSVLMAFPVGMALATGTEAPASAVAQLDQLQDRDRVRFGRFTIWMTLGIVATLTMGLTVLAVHLHAGVPPTNSTLMAIVAHDSVGNAVWYPAFQITSALLLLAAANSSFNAGPGLLKALSRTEDGTGLGILPAFMGRSNQHHTPYWGVAAFVLAACSLVFVASGQDQVLVLFYAVAVFLSFLFGLIAMAAFSWRERRFGWTAVNVAGAFLVLVTLAVDMARLYPIVSVAGAFAIGGLFYWRWVRAGRPSGIAQIEEIATLDGQDAASERPPERQVSPASDLES